MEQQTEMMLAQNKDETKENPTFIEGSSPDCAMKRPMRNEEYVVRNAAEKLAEECVKWDDTSDKAEWVESFIKIRHDWDNGYEMAKSLEYRCHVQPDAELVEILNDASSMLYEAHRDAVKKWVGIVGFKPAYKVGDEVQTRHGVGKVSGIYLETAQYAVKTEPDSNSAYVLNAEDVSSI